VAPRLLLEDRVNHRMITLSRTGRHAVIRGREGLAVVDALGNTPRITVPGGVIDFACAGTSLWVLRGDGVRLERYALPSGRLAGSIALAEPATRLHGGGDALVVHTRDGAPVLVHGDDVLALDVDGLAFPIGGRRVAAIERGRLRVLEVGRRASVIADVPLAGEPLAVHALFGGRMLAVVARDGDGDAWTVFDAAGARVHHVAATRAARWSVASDAGLALVVAADGLSWSWLDLRYGTVRAHSTAPWALDDLDLSADGRHAVFAAGDVPEPRVLHVRIADLLANAQPLAAVEEPAEAPQELARGSSPQLEVEAEAEAQSAPPDASEASSDARAAPSSEIRTDVEIAALLPRAFGEPLPPLSAKAAEGWVAYASAREHLDDVIGLVAARVARAIAVADDGGRSGANEVRALVGDRPTGGLASDELRRAEARVALANATLTNRVRASLATGVRLPLVELMRELDLSPNAGLIAMVAIGAAERANVARLLAILGGDAQKPVLDRGLLELVLGDRVNAAAISKELAPGAPLRRHGVVHVAGDTAGAAIAIEPVVVERCCGRVPEQRAPRRLEDLCVSPDAIQALANATAQPRPAADPLRLVVYGRRGSGRRTAIAALAARVGRGIAEIDATRLGRGADVDHALLRELRRATLLGRIPVVDNLELADPADAVRLRHALRAHAGPIVFRTGLDTQLPLDPGASKVTFPALTEAERTSYWRLALARAGLAGDANALAARWRLAPGQIEEVIGRAAAQPTLSIDDIARAHVAVRLSHVATPVRRLAAWDQVALPDEMIDSVRELIGRAAHRRTVFEDWGFDRAMSTSRGLTALFYGPPGTGKSMVAGLVARELGLELYRIDLSRVMSKWLGETEKNLAEVFDAAEDGQVVLLFDEADSLFARRTEVRTSNDRYANLEVNYLLQRLDSFEGIAILTTNLDGSIDPAFKRRMSMRLHFPFPDEDMRRRLWETHIPDATPTASDFDFATLARRFPLSGGYIRNSVLRAAFIAAHERRPLSNDHLMRAVALEYRELGKLATDGKLE
jgi:ATP-dependent 26S proteasome regulatory subunit